MHEQTMINQEAQDHAVACAFFARLLGQRAPSFIRLPVLNKNLDKPTQGMPLDNIKRPPTQVRGDQIAIAFFLLIFDRHDKPTVCLGVTSSVAYTYGYGDGRSGPARCAVIAGAHGDRWSRCQGCSTPPAGARSARSGLAAGSRLASTADPAGFHRSRTTLPSATTPCGDAT